MKNIRPMAFKCNVSKSGKRVLADIDSDLEYNDKDDIESSP